MVFDSLLGVLGIWGSIDSQVFITAISQRPAFIAADGSPCIITVLNKTMIGGNCSYIGTGGEGIVAAVGYTDDGILAVVGQAVDELGSVEHSNIFNIRICHKHTVHIGGGAAGIEEVGGSGGIAQTLEHIGFGPGDVLKGLIRKINPTKNTKCPILSKRLQVHKYFHTPA